MESDEQVVVSGALGTAIGGRRVYGWADSCPCQADGILCESASDTTLDWTGYWTRRRLLRSAWCRVGCSSSAVRGRAQGLACPSRLCAAADWRCSNPVPYAVCTVSVSVYCTPARPGTGKVIVRCAKRGKQAQFTQHRCPGTAPAYLPNSQRLTGCRHMYLHLDPLRLITTVPPPPCRLCTV